jgi:hypothetical protein
MAQPSIKGTAFQAVLEDVASLVRSGQIDQATLEAATKPEDRDLLDETLVPGIWYPVQSYTRMHDLLWDVVGHNEPSYLVDRGAHAAERILSAGAYANRVETTGRWGGEQMIHSVLSVSKGLFNFVDVEIRFAVGLG